MYVSKRSLNMVLIHLPDGTNSYGSTGGKTEKISQIRGLKVMFPGALATHLFRHFCCRVYHLAIMHSITNRQTDGQTDRQTVLCQ